MRNLLFQMRRVGKHLKSIIQKIMDRLLKGTSVGAKSIGSFIGILLYVIAAVCLTAPLLLFVIASLLTEGRPGLKPEIIENEPTIINVTPLTVV